MAASEDNSTSAVEAALAEAAKASEAAMREAEAVEALALVELEEHSPSSALVLSEAVEADAFLDLLTDLWRTLRNDMYMMNL